MNLNEVLLKSTVEGIFLFGSMCLSFAPQLAETMVILQLKFERSLLSMPHWTPPELLRTLAGWKLDWHEKVMFDATGFKAVLWCSTPDILVHGWYASHNLPGRTFAKE